MIEKGKISSFQMALILFPAILATAVLVVPAITSQHAGRDMWISPLWASVVGVLTVVVAHALHQRHPGQTVIQYCESLLGTVLGKAIGLQYLFFYLHMTGIIVREYAEFVVGTFLARTPLILVMGSMVLIAGFAVRGGLEVIGRLAELFVPVFVALLVLSILLILPELEPTNMLPILENGLAPSFKGALVPLGWLSEMFLLAFLLPFLSDPENGRKAGFVTAAALIVTMTVANLVTLWLFGDITSKLSYPIMTGVQYIDIADFLQNVESIVMAIWVTGAFVKIAAFYYVLVLGTAQWLHLTDYRPLALPMGLLILGFALWSAPGFADLVTYLWTSIPLYLTTMQTVLPLGLLLISALRGRRSPSSGLENPDRVTKPARSPAGPAGTR
ncbi:MAG TPA: endospore germination permease [Calditerricola sp.]